MFKLVVLATFINVAFSYNFSDVYYNRALTDELDNVLQSYSALERRQDPRHVDPYNCPPRKPTKECCKTHFLANDRNQLIEMKKQCFVDVYGHHFHHHVSQDPFTCRTVTRYRRKIVCFIQCIAQKSNLADSDGNIRRSQFAAWARDNFKDSWITPRLKNIIPKCIREARNHDDSEEDGHHRSCNPASMKVLYCLYREIQVNCPRRFINDRRVCARFRANLQKSRIESGGIDIANVNRGNGNGNGNSNGNSNNNGNGNGGGNGDGNGNGNSNGNGNGDSDSNSEEQEESEE